MKDFFFSLRCHSEKASIIQLTGKKKLQNLRLYVSNFKIEAGPWLTNNPQLAKRFLICQQNCHSVRSEEKSTESS